MTHNYDNHHTQTAGITTKCKSHHRAPIICHDINDTTLTSITCIHHSHTVLCAYTHVHTQCKLQSTPMCLCTLVRKWPGQLALKKHHRCKFQVMTTTSASEIFAVVNERKTPYIYIYNIIYMAKYKLLYN